MEGFLEALDLKEVTVVGESIGGAIALSTASENRGNRIKKVIALNPYDYAEKGAGGIKRSSYFAWVIFTTMEWPGIGWIVSRTENKLILKKILQGGFHKPENLPDDLLDLFNHVGSREGYRQAEKNIFHHWETWVNAKKKYEQIHLPVTLVYGDSDWSKTEERLENQKKIENSELIILKETGHFSALDSPDQVIQIILDHADNGQRLDLANAQ